MYLPFASRTPPESIEPKNQKKSTVTSSSSISETLSTVSAESVREDLGTLDADSYYQSRNGDAKCHVFCPKVRGTVISTPGLK